MIARLAIGRSNDHVPAVAEELLAVDHAGDALALHRDRAVLHDLERADGDVEETVQRLWIRLLEGFKGCSKVSPAKALEILLCFLSLPFAWDLHRCTTRWRSPKSLDGIWKSQQMVPYI